MVFGQQGEAFIDVHANTDPYDRELERGIRQSSKDAEKILDVIGEQWGEDLADGISKEIGRHGKDIADEVDRSVKRNKINIDGEWFTVDRHGRLHDVAGRWARRFEEEIETEFERLARPGGPLGNIGQGVADAIGAGFNVSGRSPLIALLIPVFGAIAGVIAAAIQALNAFVALLVTLPALIASLGLQIGVLFIAFQGLGERIQAAFAATNAKELEKALFGLDEGAKRFVRSLLPLRDFWRDLQMVVQQNFFGQLADPISRLLDIFRRPLLEGFAQVAAESGRFFQSFADFLASPTFVAFVKDVFPATTKWMREFGPSFLQFLSTLIALADLALPFLNEFGELLTSNFRLLADTIREDLISGDFKNWLSSMHRTLELVFELLGQIIGFTATFLVQLDTAGGKELIRTLADFFSQLAFFLASPVGQQAMEGLVNIMIISIKIVGGLIVLLLTSMALLETMGEALNAFFMFLVHVVGPAVVDFFVGLAHEIGDFIGRIKKAFEDLYRPAYESFIRIRDTIAARIEESVAFIRSLPDRGLALLNAVKERFFNAGRALIQALKDGMMSMLNPLISGIQFIIGKVTDFLPGSPAETGPLSGQGYALYRGQRMMQDLIKGMKMEIPALGTATNQAMTNINFGKGAIEIGFSGAVPTRDEAERTGTAVGNGINVMLATQRTRLAVRTL